MGKRETDLEWIVDDSPDDRRPADQRGARRGSRRPPPTASAETPRPPSFLRRHRRWLLPLGGGLLVLSLIVYAVYWLGWQRVRASLTEQIIYEDAHSAAGDVDAVLAIQAGGDDTWLNWRAAQVRLGLASLLPNESFTPLPDAPRLLRLDVRETGRFDAVVLRTFADSAGQTYGFEYKQRFHQMAPGIWESLPPDTGALTETRTWTGLRLQASFPRADERWMLAELPKIDNALQTTCQEWSCPFGTVVPVVFQGQLPALPRPNSTPTSQTYRRQLLLLSLQLTGYPHDAAASQALAHALTAQLIEQLAVQIAAPNRYVRLPFLDALITRALIRRQAAPELAGALQPADLAAPAQLWPPPTSGQSAVDNPGPRQRQQALRFLNDVILHFPSGAEAALLREAGRASSLAQWLNQALPSVDGRQVTDDWLEQATGQMAAGFPAQWAALDGLAYTCPGGAWLVRSGPPMLLPIDPTGVWLPDTGLSPDGRWLAAAHFDGASVTILDLAGSAPSASQVVTQPVQQTWPLGWMPDGQLLLARNPLTPIVFGLDNEFELLNPASRQANPLGTLRLAPENWRTRQLLVHGQLALNLPGGATESPLIRPAVVNFAGPLEPLVPGDQGLSPSLSPDGRWLAYLPVVRPEPNQPWPPAHITLFDTVSQQSLQVLISESVPDGQLLHDPASLTWLPDGSGLAFLVGTGDARTRLMRLRLDLSAPTAGADLTEIDVPGSIASLAGISSDNRYLAAAVPAVDPIELLVIDLTTNRVAARAAIAPGARFGSAWSPTGHHLAVQGPAGLYILDPATNDQQWITTGRCQPTWYNLNANP